MALVVFARAVVVTISVFARTIVAELFAVATVAFVSDDLPFVCVVFVVVVFVAVIAASFADATFAGWPDPSDNSRRILSRSFALPRARLSDILLLKNEKFDRIDRRKTNY
uniref:Uncharacterized protein n=1 Tax=Glossina pallidipes TaxID=7398 RepID=A0A1B0AK85_GLOPL